MLGTQLAIHMGWIEMGWNSWTWTIFHRCCNLMKCGYTLWNYAVQGDKSCLSQCLDACETWSNTSTFIFLTNMYKIIIITLGNTHTSKDRILGVMWLEQVTQLQWSPVVWGAAFPRLLIWVMQLKHRAEVVVIHKKGIYVSPPPSFPFLLKLASRSLIT